jgi:hypothetical protein
VREQLIAVHGQCRDLGRYGTMAEKLEAKVSALIGSGAWDVIAPCEVWTEAVTRAIEADARRRAAYLALLEHCRKALGLLAMSLNLTRWLVNLAVR